LGDKQYTKIRQSLEYFRRFGLFSESDDESEVIIEGGGLPETIQQLEDKVYTGFADSCMLRAGGVYSEAKRLFDCSYFEYYWAIVLHNRYVESHNKLVGRVGVDGDM